MTDPRITQMADILVHHSLRVQAGDRFYSLPLHLLNLYWKSFTAKLSAAEHTPF